MFGDGKCKWKLINKSNRFFFKKIVLVTQRKTKNGFFCKSKWNELKWRKDQQGEKKCKILTVYAGKSFLEELPFEKIGAHVNERGGAYVLAEVVPYPTLGLNKEPAYIA